MDFLESFKKKEEELLEKDFLGQLEEDLKSIKVTSLSYADDCLEYYKEVEKEIKTIEEYSEKKLKEYTKRINEFKEKNIKPLESKLELIEGLLRRFYEEKSKDDKPIKLVNGRLGYYKTRENLIYNDLDMAMKTILLKRPDLVRIKYEPKKNDIKKEIDVYDDEVYLDGEKIEGVEYVSSKKEFRIK